MVLKSAKCDLNGIKIAIFSKKLQKNAQHSGAPHADFYSLQRSWALPQAPSVIRLSCTILLTPSPNFDIFVKLINLRF